MTDLLARGLGKQNKDAVSLIVGTGLFPEQYPRLLGETDDSGMINRAISDAFTTGIKVVRLAGKEYSLKNTVNLKKGINLIGAGMDNTIIKRAANVVAIKAEGDSVLSTNNPRTRNDIVIMEGFTFHGADYLADYMQLIACGLIYVQKCRFIAMTGRQVYMKECMDSRFNNCLFEWGGSTDGTLPAIELASGDNVTYEYTNQIHFVGCRWETYRGTAVMTTGSNTNEIYFRDCKMESLISNSPHVVLQNANAVNLGTLNICSRGSVGQTLSSQVVMDNCKGIYGMLWLEHTGTIDTASAKIDKFVDIKNSSSDIELLVHVYQNGANTVQSNPVMVDATADIKSVSINGTVRGNTRDIANVMRLTKTLQVTSNTPKFRMKHTWVTGWEEYWDAVLVPDGNGTKYSLIHNKDGAETTIYTILNSGDIQVYKNLFMSGVAFHPSQISTTAPWGREGSVYVDTSVAPNCTRTYSNGAWRRVGYAGSFGSFSGSWNTGDIVYNTTTTEAGTAGSKYIVLGWKRVGAGSGHVLNTDWFEMRMLTGN